MTNNLQVNVFTTDLEWRANIDSVNTLVHRTSWNEMQNSEISIGKTVKNVEEMQVGRILVINNQLDKALIIEDMTTSLDDELWNFILIPLKGILNYRICHPVDSGGGGGAPWVARRQSEIMTFLVYDNLIKQTRDIDRYFQNSTKSRNMLNTAPTKSYGDIIDFSVDWKTGYIGDAVATVSKMFGETGKYPLGWNIYIKEDFSGFEFDVFQGIDKTISQEALPPVVFSEEFGNIKNATYEYSIKEWRNLAYVSWKDGSIEKNNAVWNLTYGDTSDFNRKEIIIDSSKKTVNEVKAEGRSELNKRPHVESFTAEIINNENTMTTYKKDWVIGDIVTIQSREIFKGLQISLDTMVTGIEEIYDDGEYTINATFGEEKLTFLQLIKNAINQK
jgi:Siphovirus ReqiPepy6 Gp37-like protein